MAPRTADLPAGGMIPDSVAGPRRRLEAVSDSRPLRALIYVRQSLKNEESISLELQEEIDRAYCARQGYVVLDVIPDQITGRKWEKRKGIKQVMQMVMAGEVDRVVIYRWSRISRVRLHQAQAIYLIEEAGAQLESATEPFDTRTAAGKFGRDQMLSFAAFQGDLIGEQWTEVHDRRRGDGLPHCGGKRFGYIYDRGEYTPDEALAETDRWRYQAYIDGMGMRAIAAELNRRGILNARGRPWNDTALAEGMDSGFSAGFIPIGVAAGQLDWLPGKHAANIEPDVWQAYRAARKRRATVPPRVLEPTYPLTGMVRCGDLGCGAALRICSKSEPGKKSVPGYYYRCTNRLQPGVGKPVGITRARLEADVLGWLRELADDVDAGAAAADETKRAKLRAKINLDAASREVARIDRQLTRLTLQRAADEEMPEAVYTAARNELLAERATAQGKVDAALHAADLPERPPREVSIQLIRDWDILAVRARRDMLAKLIRVILVHPPTQKHGPSTTEIIPVWAPPTD